MVSMLQGMFVWINRIRGMGIDAKHPFHSSYDTTYGTAHDGADRSCSLIADRRAMSDSSQNSLGLSRGGQGKRHNKAQRDHDVNFRSN